MDSLTAKTNNGGTVTSVSSITSGPDSVSSFESPEVNKKDSLSVTSLRLDSDESLVDVSNEVRVDKTLGYAPTVDAPPIDPHALQDLETHAKRIAEQVCHTMSLLKSSSYKVSALTLDSVEYFSNTVDNVCDSVDADIKALYALIAKSEEISKELSMALALQDDVNNVKRILDQLESAIVKEVKKM